MHQRPAKRGSLPAAWGKCEGPEPTHSWVGGTGPCGDWLRLVLPWGQSEELAQGVYFPLLRQQSRRYREYIYPPVFLFLPGIRVASVKGLA